MGDTNEIYKDILLEVTIDARRGSRTQAIETRATFFSHDIKSGLVKINLQKDGEPLPLAVGTEILVSLTKPFEKGKGKLIYSPEIVDRDNGVAHWPIPEQIQGETGIFRAGVYVRYPNGQRIHGGYFTFQKEISEIDEEMEPWTESYWQGWAEFQEEAETAWSEWQANREYDWTQWTTDQQQKQDAFEADTNAQMSTLTKQLNDLELQTDELDQKQKYLIAQLADYMTKEQFVKFLAGETIEITKTADLKGKVPGSVVENPHYFRRNGATTSLVPPSGLWPEVSANQYQNLELLDGKVVITDSRVDAGYYAQSIVKWNLIEQVNRDYPGIFESVGATTLAGKVAILKELFTNFNMSVWGYGSGPNGNKLTAAIWNGAAWTYNHVNSSGSVVRLGYTLADTRYINADGFMYQLAYADPSDGTTPSSVSIDYAQLAYSLKLSLYDFVPKKGDVYDKTQADQRFVSLSENQTVGGVKNFIERPQLNGTGLLAKGEAQMVKVTNDDGGAILSMDNSKTLARWIAEAGWGVHSCYMAGDVAGGTGFSGRGLIVNNESETQMAGSGYILVNKVSTLDFNNGLMVRHFLPDTASGGIVWTSDWLKCGSTNKTRLTPIYTGVAAGQTIQLSKDIRNFSMLAVNTGGVSDNANITQMILPWSDGTWRPAADGSMDRFAILTASGAPVVVTLRSYTTLQVESTPTGAAGIRYIDGIM